MTTEFPPLPDDLYLDAQLSELNGTVSDRKTDPTALDAATRDAEEQEEAVIDAGLRSLDHCMAYPPLCDMNPKTRLRCGCGCDATSRRASCRLEMLVRGADCLLAR